MTDFKNEVMRRLESAWAYRKDHEDNPELAVSDLIQAEIEFALDPVISSRAIELVERGRHEALEEILSQIDKITKKTPTP